MMDSTNHHHLHLGVNKLGKAIKKDYTATGGATSSSSSTTTTATSNNGSSSSGGGGGSHLNAGFAAPPATRASQQPPVYNISKSDFRAFVQQLTGAGTSSVLAPRPPTHPNPRPAAGNRLQQVRPPPLASFPRPATAVVPDPAQPLPRLPAESPVSTYLRYLESSLLHSDGSRGMLSHTCSSQALPAVPSPAASPLGFLSPNSFLNLPSPNPLMLSPGTLLQPPASPGLFFPQSPSDFLLSPRWRDM